MVNTMKHVLLSAAVATVCGALVLGASAPAFAKAPPSSKSAEELISKAIQDELDRKAAEAEAKRDHNKEMIDNFKDKAKGVPLSDGLKLADIIVRAQTDEKLIPYRAPAAAALLQRFALEDTKNDPAIRDVRRDIALAMLDLMKSKDEGSVAVIDFVLKEWYMSLLRDVGWKVEGKAPQRLKAYNDMKKKLSKDK